VKSVAFAVVAAAMLSSCAILGRENGVDEVAAVPDRTPALQCPPPPACNCAPAKVAPKAECPAAVSESENLLAYFERVRKLGGSELNREYDSARQSFARARTDSNRVRYAMVLSVPGASFNDETRALEALDPLVNNSASNLHHLALLTSTQIQAQRRERELAQKLDALKSLDKSLIERGW
jgi:hypothetical protein